MDSDEERIQSFLEQPDDIMVSIIAAMPLHEMLRLARASTEWRGRFMNLADRVLMVHPAIHKGSQEEYRATRPLLSRQGRYDYLLAAAYVLTYPNVRAWRLCRILGRPESVVSNTLVRFCIALLLPPVDDDHRLFHQTVAMHSPVTRSEMESIFPESGIQSWPADRATSLLMVTVLYLLRSARSMTDIFGIATADLPMFLEAFMTMDKVLVRFVVPYLSEKKITMGHVQPLLLDYPNLNNFDFPAFWENFYFSAHMALFLTHFIPLAKTYDPRICNRAFRTIQNIIIPCIRLSYRIDKNKIAGSVQIRIDRFYWTMDQRERALHLLPVLMARHAALLPVDPFLTLPGDLYARAPNILDAILNRVILEDKDGVILVFVKELIAGNYYALANSVLTHPKVLLYRQQRLLKNYALLQEQVLLHVSQ
jgi:hypothetical protein